MSPRETPRLTLPGSIVSIVQASPRLGSPVESAPDLKAARTQEFELGRALATTALNQAGWQNNFELDIGSVIGRNEDRSPIWPEGFVGSISHSNRWVWVAVARAEDFVSIGIDTEMIVDPARAKELRGSIGCDPEWDCLSKEGCDDEIAFTLMFSAKETFFKLFYPLTKVYWEFLDLELAGIRLNPQSPTTLAGEIFLRSKNKTSNTKRSDQRTQISATSNYENPDRAHPVNFQIIDQDVFTFASIQES